LRREGCEGQSVAKRDKKDAKAPAKGSLGAAATALEDAISRYEDLVASAGRIPLHTQKNLEKAAEALQSAATLQDGRRAAAGARRRDRDHERAADRRGGGPATACAGRPGANVGDELAAGPVRGSRAGGA